MLADRSRADGVTEVLDVVVLAIGDLLDSHVAELLALDDGSAGGGGAPVADGALPDGGLNEFGRVGHRGEAGDAAAMRRSTRRIEATNVNGGRD